MVLRKPSHVAWKSLLGGACALALAACGNNQDAQAPAADAPATPPVTQINATPAMWQVGDDDTTIYFLGTVHILKPGTDWKTDKLMAAFDASDTVYLELDGESPEAQQEMTRLVMTRGMMQDGRTFFDLLNEEETALVDAALEDAGIPRAMIAQFQPWLAGLTISLQAMIADGYDASSGVDTNISAMAKEAGKTLAYFETAEEQIGFFADFSIEEQKAFTLAGIRQAQAMPDMLDIMVDVWARGDADRLAEIMNEGMSETPELADVLLRVRNENWVEEIERLIAGEGTYFIAVGAGHLSGPDSVNDMLTAKGYELIRYQ